MILHDNLKFIFNDRGHYLSECCVKEFGNVIKAGAQVAVAGAAIYAAQDPAAAAKALREAIDAVN
ncbi:hypothetical protein [Chitinophaga sp. LS1]|uniref:hypothetical protein n=1 Tax=Chitinophaga sp. LS1 TaxID=3051176 RepID=UPI0009D56827|nr:hypothetical protein [Chitinophaga sp. LS1]OMP79251.1 hypothetical protein BW716_10350 [[Flexibacter] sp. ATCC 35208]WPV63793.1 hypothetical protein QQL36_18510 [Chitinophaga sp. LS1]